MNATDYQDYLTRIADFEKREQIPTANLAPVNQQADPWFSWRECECCHRPEGGNREYYSAVRPDGEIVKFALCEDCIYFAAYGQLENLWEDEFAVLHVINCKT